MKHFVLTLFSLTLFANTFTVAQECDDHFYRMEPGSTFFLTSYDKKDKVTGRQENVVTDVDKSGEGLTATISTKLFDKKDKLITEGEFSVICEGSSVKIDMDQMLSSMEQLKSLEGMDTEIETDYIMLPADLEVGQDLPDSKATIKMKMGSGNANMMSNEVIIKDRKVEAEEEITTPAGTFTCYKITYNTDINTKVMGMNRTDVFSGAEWFARNVGMVKSESYNKKGELQSYMLLTKLE